MVITLILGLVIYNRYQVKLKANKKLEELDRLKSSFFANISHEFRTPLTLIMGPLEQQLQENRDEKVQKEAHVMHRNATRLLQLINQLLDLSKLESGNLKLKVQKANVTAFLKPIGASFSSLAENRGIHFKVDLLEDEKEGY